MARGGELNEANTYLGYLGRNGKGSMGSGMRAPRSGALLADESSACEVVPATHSTESWVAAGNVSD